MVAIFTGLGSGFERGSAAQLGGAGMLGSSVLGRTGQQLFLNAATGNLLVQQQDEFLVGRGPDVAIGRTYNSLGNLTDENGDNWRQNTDRRVFGLTGTANQAGSTIKRRSADGSEIIYSYNVAAAAYLTTDGAGAHDKLVYDGVNSWKWTDGSSQVIETYGPSSTAGQWWITGQKDPSGNALVFTYTSDRLTRVTTADGGYTDYSWDTTNNRITQIVTGYLDLAQAGTPARTLTRTRYAYDAQNRLSTVTVDLTPGDNSIAAGRVFSTHYAYHGSSTRIASIAQSDGTRVDIDYVLKGSDHLVSEISQWVDDVSVRTTRIDYDQVNGITTITGPDGIATRLFHDAQGRLTKVVEASPQQDVEERVRTYSYDANGNVIEVRVHDGLDQVGTSSALSWIKYGYDANGNVTQELRNDGLNIRRTYSAANELLTETSYVGYGGDELSDAAPSGGMTSRFVYDNKLLRYSISAAGHVTAYEYSYGELVRTINFPAHAYDVSALGPTSVPTYGTMQSWVGGLTNKSSAQIQDINRDARGNVIKITNWSAATSAGASDGAKPSSVQHFIYDQAGNLLAQWGDGVDRAIYVYDGLGRRIAATDAAGATQLTIYRDELGQVDTITVPAGGNLIDTYGWLISGDNARGPNLVDLADWPASPQGPNLVDLTGWPHDPQSLPPGQVQVGGWPFYSWSFDSAVWTSGIGPNGLPMPIIHSGQTTTNTDGGANYTNYFAADGAKGYEVRIAFQFAETTPPNSHGVHFGVVDQLSSTSLVNAETGAPVVHNNFISGIASSSAGFEAGRWYEVVAYILPDGSPAIPAGSLGGVYDMESGAKIRDVTNLRWNGAAPGTTIAARFQSYSPVSEPGYFTKFGQPAVRELNLEGGAALIQGWQNPTPMVDESRWARVIGPDGAPAWAMQAGQLDGAAQGGGNQSNAIDIDGSKTYEFTYYFQKTDTSKHTVAFGLSLGSSSAYVVYGPDGTTPVTNPYFLNASAAWQQANLQEGEWYKVVGYVFAEGSKGVANSTAGGVFDSAGNKVASVTNFIWNENRPDDLVYTRFFDFYDQNQTGYSTNFLKPEVREIDSNVPVPNGPPTTVAGWPSILYHGDETKWERVIGPDGTPAMVLAAGQVDAGTEGGGAFTNPVAIDKDKPYEFSLYFQVTEQNKHRLHFGLLFADPATVVNGNNNTPVTSPYFAIALPNSGNGLQVGKWYKISAYVLPQGYVAADYSGLGGVYDAATGQRMFGVTNFRWNPASTASQVSARFFVYDNATAPGYFTHFYGASIREARSFARSSLTEIIRTDSIRFNRAGEMISTETSGKDVARAGASYQYDDAGRLTSVTDVLGNKTRYLYDHRGRQTAVIAADGSVSESRYDALDRLVATVAYATRLTEPQLAAIDMASAGASIEDARPAANAADCWAWRVYDAGGRLQQAIDGNGAVQAYEYNGSDQLIRTTHFKTLLLAPALNALKIAVSAVTPTPNAAQDAVSRLFYDGDGRLIATLDAEGYLTRSYYDAAGQLVKTVAYLNPTWAGHRQSGALSALEHNLSYPETDRVRHFVYDGQGNLRYEIDALNHVVEYSYHAGGTDAHGVARSTIAYDGVITLPATLDVASVAAAIATANLASDADTRRSFAVHDSAGRLTFTIGSEGLVTRFEYDELGRVIRTRVFDETHAITTLPTLVAMESWALTNTDADDRLTRSYYDGADRLVYSVDPLGYVTQNIYDLAGRVEKVRRFDAAITLTDNDTLNRVATLLASATTALAYSQAHTSYDALGRVSIAYDAIGTATKYEYSATGLLTQVTVAFGTADASSTTYAYDAVGRIVSQTSAAGTPEAATIGFAYDGLGNLVTLTDARLNQTTRTYDRLGRILTETDALSGVISFTYNAFDENVLTVDQRGASTWRYFDRAGRVIAVRDAENYVTHTQYTAFGEVASVTRRYNKATGTALTYALPIVASHAKDAVTSYTYDRAGRVVVVEDAEDYLTESSYTAFGEIKTVERADATTRFAYDKLGRVTRTTDALQNYEEYTLDAFGNRIAVRNKLGGITTNTFDRRGQLVTESIAVSGKYSGGDGPLTTTTIVNKYEYDKRGNLTKTIEAFGAAEVRHTIFAYDKLDRLTSKTGDAVLTQLSGTLVTPTETYTYDAAGNLIESVDANGARTLFYYDDLNRKIADVDPTGAVRTYGYDAAGNLVTARAYDARVNLGSLTAGGTLPLTGSYRETTHQYDALNRLQKTFVLNTLSGAWVGSSYVITDSNSAPDYLVTEYNYDAVGNVIKTIDPNGNAAFSYYDKLGRKTAQVDQENYLTTWALDAEGNVLTERRYATRWNNTVTTAAPPSVGIVTADRITEFTYDTLGRRLTETRKNVEAWSVNGLGQLSTANGDAEILYTYNELGQVKSKREANGDTTSYTYDNAGRLIVEERAGFVDYNNAAVRPTLRYFYDGLDQLTSTRQGNFATASDDRITTDSYAAGRLSSTTDAAGFVRTYHYDPAGRVVAESYNRQLSSGATVTEALFYVHDAAGRAIAQTFARHNGTAWVHTDANGQAYDATRLSYNAHGELTGRGITAGHTVAAVYQEHYDYDAFGRMWRTNAGDGVLKFQLYDKAGRQTLTLTSAGADLSALTLADYAASITSTGGTSTPNAVTTVTAYDKRGMVIHTREPGRQLTGDTGVTILQDRTYNAFGEVATESNRRRDGDPTALTSFTYNNMGRLITKVSPQVSVTSENGSVNTTATPTEHYRYDIAGRLIGTKDANGNTLARALLAGTGHGGSEALVAKAFNADGADPDATPDDAGVFQTFHDVFGDARTLRNQLGSANTAAPYAAQTDELHSYDAMGRVTSITRRDNPGYGHLIDRYEYDMFGQRLRHWIEEVGTTPTTTINDISAYVEKTDYDAQGRVVSSVAMGGDTTTTSYSWNAALATSGLGTFGGWVETTTYANGRTSIEQTDMFGHTVQTTDMGGYVASISFDKAGRTATRSYGGEVTAYTWFNTGLIGRIATGFGNAATAPYNEGEDYALTVQTSTYDANGNKLSEQSHKEDGKWRWHEDELGGYWNYESNYQTLQNATATYDALGRLKTWNEAGTTTTSEASTTHDYDANGNIRRTQASFRHLDTNGAPSGTVTTTDSWYRYDSMNRVATAKGVQTGSGIARGTQGVDLLYDKAGNRVRATRTVQRTGTVWDPNYDVQNPYPEYPEEPTLPGTGGQVEVPYTAELREDYRYWSDGQLREVRIAESGYSDNGDGTLTVTPPPATGALKASYWYDVLGRLERQIDWTVDPDTDPNALGEAAYDRKVNYNTKSQVSSEIVYQREGSITQRNETTNNYGSGTGYALGAVVSSTTEVQRTSTPYSTSSVTNYYSWRDGAVLASTTLAGTTSGTTTYRRNGAGVLEEAEIIDGRARTVTFHNDVNGQVIRRNEQDAAAGGDPQEIWHRFAGKQMGYVGNNGTLDTDYQASIDGRELTQGTGAFRNGASYGGSYADFDLFYDPLTSHSQGAAGGSYTAQGGETLGQLAAQLWGDASLWYKLAEANPGAGDTLAAGQTLRIPSGVQRSTHTAATFAPYDPAETLGDTSPTTPTPKAPKKGNKCGVFGAILIAVVAVAVTAILASTIVGSAAIPAVGSTAAKAATGLTAILGGAGASAGSAAAIGAGIIGGGIAGAAGSIASQAFGLATGIQQGGFNWGAVAMAGISGGIGGGLGGSGLFNTGSPFLSGALRGAAGNALTQGAAVATRLQSKFDFAGVAASAAGGGASAVVGGSGFGGRLLNASADGLASAASRSVLTGTSFGDNIVAVLPGVIGRTVGSMMERMIADVGTSDPKASASKDKSENVKLASLQDDGRNPARPDQGSVMSDAPLLTYTYRPSDEEGLSVTVTDDSRSFGWKVAEFLGFHEGGFFHDLFNGNGSSGSILTQSYNYYLGPSSAYGQYIGQPFANATAPIMRQGLDTISAWRPVDNFLWSGQNPIRDLRAAARSLANGDFDQFSKVPPILGVASGPASLARLGPVAETTINAAHPLAGIAARDVVGVAASKGLQTQRDSLILWSGLGREGPARAQAFAREFGGTTLEMTPGGKWLDSMDLFNPTTSPYTRAEAEMIWGETSARMVGQASGQVRSVLGQVRPNSVYRTYEMPALQQNPAILGLDPLYLHPMLKASGY